MKLTDLSVKRPVAVLMFVAIVVLLGVVSYSRLNLDLYPDIKLPVAAVIISYPGAGPEEVESQVTEPVEEIVGTVANIKEIYSTTRAGSSVVICRFNWGTDMDFASLQLREKVDMVKKYLPSDIDTPMVIKMDPAMMPVLQIGMTGPRDLAELKTLAEDEFKSALERIPGVASVAITGGLVREVQVAVDPLKLENYGLSLGQVAQVLGSDNFNLPGGDIDEAGKTYFVRNLGEFQDLEEIRSLPLANASGKTVYLCDIAEVTDGFKDVTQITRMNGRPSIGIHVLKQSDANTVEVAEAVKKEIEKIKKRLPQNIEVVSVFDQSTFIKQSLDSVKRSALEGAVLAVLVIFLFLRSMRSTLVIASAIPISIVSTFSMMYFAGISFNLVSMGGLALGIGRMVDDAIVVLESIYRYRQQGYSLFEAARQGASEVGNAVMAATFTTIAVFLPIVYVEGISSLIFKQLAMTVSFAIFSSLLVALTLVPMLSSKILTAGYAGIGTGFPAVAPGGLTVNKDGESTGSGGHEKPGGADAGEEGGGYGQELRAAGRIKRILDRWGMWIDRLNGIYLQLLKWSLGHRKAVVAGVAGCLVLSLGLVPMIGAEFLPAMDSGEISIDVQMDKGSVLEKTDNLVKKIEKKLEAIPEVETVFASVGPSGDMMIDTGSAQPDVARLRVVLVSRTERKKTVDQIADEIRESLSVLPGAKIKVSAADPVMHGVGSSSPVSISIKGEDLNTLKVLAGQVAEKAAGVEGTREIDTTLSSGYPEVQIRVNRQAAFRYGLTALQVASTVKAAVEGQVATRYRTGGDEIDVRVRLKEDARENLRRLEDLAITTPAGTSVRLADVASLEYSAGPTEINRENQVRVATVTGEIFGRDLRSVMADIEDRVSGMPLPDGYVIEFGGTNEDMIESFQSLSFALLLAVVLVYMVMAVLYESLLYPFVIMFTMPTMVIGAILSLALTGRTFSVTAFIGLIMLVGIVVSNGIVLVDYINTLRGRGMGRNEAILTAGPVRLRPILMTALTTILAMFPLALGLGEGGEAQAHLATVVVGGMTVSTFLTLVFIPVVYTLFDDLGGKIKEWWIKKVAAGAGDVRLHS